MTKLERAIKKAKLENTNIYYEKCGTSYYSESPYHPIKEWVDETAFGMAYIVNASSQQVDKFYLSRNGWGAKNKKEKKFFEDERKRLEEWKKNNKFMYL